jgi:tape measure domain-containing protein
MSTLEKLKQRINESNSGKALDGLNKVDLSNIKDSIDSVNKHFSLLGIAALKVKSSIVDGFLGMAKTLATTVPRIIKEGGWQRAMNIEEAKFQLEGLHVAWSQISDDISYAVDGTAYGLDAAAKAASQLVASGVQVGDSMKGALRAISGVAAMTNAEYEAIAPIFTTVAGQGKLMTMQLRQLENRGLNAAAVLAESMGTTEAAVRDMVTNGEIDFNTFAMAMDKAFGEHAKDANRTFVGVTANIRAALKKIGADFATPIIEQDGPVIKALQVLRERINDVRKSLGPLNDAWTAFVYNYGRVAEKLLKSIDMSFMENVTKGLVNTFNALLSIIRPIGYAIRDIFGANANSSLKSFAETFENFTAKLILSREEMEDLRATVRGVLSIFTIFTTVIKQILGAILQVKPETVDIGAIILKITGSIGDMITFISLVIKQINIIEPIISGISTVIKTLIGLLATGAIKVGEFITKLSQLKATSKIIDGVTIAVKALLAGIILLASTVKDFVIGTVEKIPVILFAIRDGLAEVLEFLRSLSIVQAVADKVTKLAEAFEKLIHPKEVRNSELQQVITIADEAVALAGPEQVSKLDRFKSALGAIGDILGYVGRAVVAVIRPIKEFIQFLGVGGILALSFTVAIGAIGIKLTQTMDSLTKVFSSTAGVLKTLGKDGVMGLIFGRKEQIKIPKILEYAAAIAILAGSLKLITTINFNDLKTAGAAMAAMTGGILIVLAALTAAQKILGKDKSLELSGSLLAIAGALAIMTASFITMSKLIDGNKAKLEAAGAAIIQLAMVLDIFAISLSKLAPELSTGSLSLLVMAHSMKMMVGVLDALSQLSIQTNILAEDYDHIWGKAGLLVAVAGALVLISGIAAKIGTASLSGILMGLLALKLIVPIANDVARSIEDSIFADAWNKLVDFWKGMPASLKKIGPYVLAAITAVGLIVGAVYAFKKLKAAFAEIGKNVKGTEKEVKKLDGLQKALARLSIVPVIVALTGMMVAIGAMVAVLGNIKIANLKQAGIIMGIVAGMFATLGLVVAASKDSKPAAIIGAIVGLTTMFSELIILSLLIEKHYIGVLGACAVMAILMHELSNVFESIAEASELSTKTLIAIGMVGGIVAELGGILYILSQQDWASMLASGAAMSACMLSFAKMLETIGATGQRWTKNKFIAMAEAAGVVAVIGASLALATLTHDWAAMLAAGVSMSAVMVTFGAMMQIVGRIQWNAGAWSAVAAIAVLAVSIGAALAIATLTHDWAAMLAAAGAMSAVMAVFGGMATIMGNTANLLSSFVMMVSVAGTAIAIAASLAMLAQYPWQDILAAAGIMAGTMAVLSGLAIGLGAIAPLAIPGAIALDLIAVSMLGLSTSASILLSALTAFLPIANAFLDNVLGTIVGLAPQLPSAALGLTEIAGGLSLVGAAGLILTAGSVGLLTTAAGLTALLPAVTLLNQIDFIKIGSGLQSIAQSGSLLIPVGVGLLAATPGFTLASGALTVFAGAIVLVAKALNDKSIKEMEKIPKKMVEIGQWIPKSLANGMNGQANTAINAAKNLASKIESTIRNKLDIHSESPLLKSIGGWVSKSIGNGIKQYADGALGPVDELGIGIIKSLKGTSSQAGQAGSDITTSLGNSLNSGLDWIEQTTGVKLSKIKNQFKQMDIYITALGGGFDFMSDPSLPDDVKRQMQEQKIKELEKLADVTNIAAEAEKNFAKASGGSSKAAKEEKEEIKDLSKAFESVAKATKKTLSQMSNNLAANLKETYSWAEDMKTFMAQTWDDTTKKWVESLGVAGHDTLRAFINATEEEAAVFKGLMPQYLTLDEDSKAMIAGDYSGLGLQIMQQYGEGIGLYSEELAENIQNAIKPFEAFNKELDVTKYQLMENLESQVKGVNEWADQLIELSNRAINENLLEYLRDMGPEGYKYVMAFGSMTDEELARTNELWDQTMNLGVTNAKKLYPTQYNNLGKAITDGFDAGIDKNKMVGTIGNALDATVTKARAIYDWHSPSGLMLSMGQDIGRGFVDGINQIWKLSVIPTVTRVSEEVVNTFKMQFNDSTGRQLGTDITQGIINGIRDREGDLYQTAWDIAYNAWQRAKEAVKSSSPSKRFAELGRNMDEGLIIGLKDKAEAVYSTTRNIGDSTVQMMNDIIKNISSEVNDSPELQPVIRPRLDLTALQNGKNSINGMFGGSSIKLANGILANKMNADSINPTVSDGQIVNNQNFIFNQTNNSPKALDAYEIYRNSRNLLGQIKGAKA